MRHRPKHFFLCTDRGLHVVRADIANQKISISLCGNDAGDDPYTEFVLCNESILTGLEIEPDLVLVGAEGKDELTAIDIKTRKVKFTLKNPSGSVAPISLVKHPLSEYVFLKDDRYLSMVDIQNKKIIPIV